MRASTVQDSLNVLLLEAVQSLDTMQVRQLISSGAEVNAKDPEGLTPLLIAASRKLQPINLHDPRYQSLSEKELRLKRREEIRKSLANSKIIKLLIDAGADISATDSAGRTPLMLACSGNSGRSVGFLLEGKSEVEARDNRGNTVLMYAVSQGYNILRLLLDAGPDLRVKNDFGETALDIAEKSAMERNAAALRQAAVAEEVKTLVEASLKDGSLFSDYNEFYRLSLLSRIKSDYGPIRFETQKGVLRTWDYLSRGSSDLFLCRVSWSLLDNPGENHGTLFVAVTVEGEKKEICFYHGLEERSFVRSQTYKRGVLGHDIVLLQQERNEWTYDIRDKLYVLKKDSPRYTICSDDSILYRLRQERPDYWNWIVNRVLQYRREREQVRLSLQPHLGDFTIAEYQYLPAWCRGDIDGDRTDDLACAVEREKEISIAILLSTRPDTIFAINPGRANDFTILPKKKAVFLNWWQSGRLHYIWNGEAFDLVRTESEP